MAVPRILSTAIDLDDASASLDLAFEVAQYFGFDDEEAAATAVQIGRALGSWSTEAERIGLYRPYTVWPQPSNTTTCRACCGWLLKLK